MAAKPLNMPELNLPAKPTYVEVRLGESFFELFKKVEAEFENCFVFESLSDDSFDARFSVLGFDPQHIISATGNQITIDDISGTHENPYHALSKMIPQDKITRNYCGGLVGYTGYDAMNFFEPALKLTPHADFSSFQFGIFTDGLIYDKATHQCYYFYYKTNRMSLVEELLSKEQPPGEECRVKILGHSKTRDEHRIMVEEAKQEIIAGNTFQCQIGFRTDIEVMGSKIALYEELRSVNPSPHMFYLKFGKNKIIGASPELMFRLRQGEMETFPLAGTTSRGKSEAEDRELARALLQDPKEIAEHNMLVDLHRNDLGRVARFFSVKVRRLMDIKKFSHVQHISSEIVGIIAENEDMFSGFASCFPAGTLSGAPKIESIKIIERIESDPRGPYGGAIGHFGFNGDCTFAIPIRTLFVSGDKAFTRHASVIVFDSTPENEYLELERKFGAIKKALQRFIV